MITHRLHVTTVCHLEFWCNRLHSSCSLPSWLYLFPSSFGRGNFRSLHHLPTNSVAPKQALLHRYSRPESPRSRARRDASYRYVIFQMDAVVNPSSCNRPLQPNQCSAWSTCLPGHCRLAGLPGLLSERHTLSHSITFIPFFFSLNLITLLASVSHPALLLQEIKVSVFQRLLL